MSLGGQGGNRDQDDEPTGPFEGFFRKQPVHVQGQADQHQPHRVQHVAAAKEEGGKGEQGAQPHQQPQQLDHLAVDEGPGFIPRRLDPRRETPVGIAHPEQAQGQIDQPGHGPLVGIRDLLGGKHPVAACHQPAAAQTPQHQSVALHAQVALASGEHGLNVLKLEAGIVHGGVCKWADSVFQSLRL